MNLRFVCTCKACPEQYDVFSDDKQVAYLRLRWGTFKVTVPDVGGTVIYHHTFDDELQGCFWSEEERETHLTAAKQAIEKYYT